MGVLRLEAFNGMSASAGLSSRQSRAAAKGLVANHQSLSSRSRPFRSSTARPSCAPTSCPSSMRESSGAAVAVPCPLSYPSSLSSFLSPLPIQLREVRIQANQQ